ncbi:MAG: hypothetical protein J6A98_01770 [Clostridia bacterium]|nr:hypothetical protein [Clostridia bacterium]
MRKLFLKLPHEYETQYDCNVDAFITAYFNSDFGDSYGVFLDNAKSFWENYFNIPSPRYEYDPDKSIKEASYRANTIFLPEILLTGKIENFADLIDVFRSLAHEYAHYYDDKTQHTFKYDESSHRKLGIQPTHVQLLDTVKLLTAGLHANNYSEAQRAATTIDFFNYRYALYWLAPQEEYAHYFEEIALMHFEKALEKKYKEIKKDWKISRKDKDFFTQKYMLAQNQIKQKTEEITLERAKNKAVLDNKDHPFPKIYNQLKRNFCNSINYFPTIDDTLSDLYKGLLSLQESERFYDQNTINLFENKIMTCGTPILKAIILGINKETSCEKLDQFIKKCATCDDFRTEDEDFNYKLGILQLKYYFDPEYVDQKYEEERLKSTKRIEEVLALMQEATTNEQEIPHAPDYEAAMREAASIQADIPEVYKTPDKQENLQENTQSTPSPTHQEKLEK